MRILYVRVSSLTQNLDRQKVREKDFDYLVEDTCSGGDEFFSRKGGKKIKSLLDKNEISTLYVHQIDRLGRNLRDILNTIHTFSSLNIPIHFLNPGLKTLNDDGTENPFAKMMISILGTISEMEKSQIRERQKEGIEIARAKGVYYGRKKGTRENPIKFLTKPKNKKAVELLEKGYKNIEIAKITGLHKNTITKIKKLSSQLNEI
jgi:DNA invertase Pin-like site-specific DNA recombinase